MGEREDRVEKHDPAGIEAEVEAKARTPEEVAREMADAAAEREPAKGSDGKGSDGNEAKSKDSGGKPPPPADRLLGYVRGEPHELFVDQFGAPHILWGGQPVPLNSTFDHHLRTLMVDREVRSAGKDAVRQARDTLAAFAFAADIERELYTRAAWCEGVLYYQLGRGKVVRVDRDGHRIEPNPPVLFRRVRNLKPLPDPKPGGDFDVLSGWVHLSNIRDKRLFIAWLVTALLPHVARPMLEATGQMGSGKTTASRIAKRLLDPTAPETVRMDPREFLQKASHAHIVMLDNQNSLPEWAVDTLCRLVTGEADSKRVLYTDDDDLIYELKRGIVMNGINNPTDRGDARDRTLPVELTRIEQFRPEEEIWAEFESEHPKLLGLIFDTLALAIRAKETIKLTRHARLADWSEYAAAVYEALGWGVEKFEEDWARVVRIQNQGTLEGSPVAQAIVSFMSSRNDYHGLVTDLHAKLEVVAEEMSIDTKRDKAWPKASNWLWKRIKEVLPLLATLGLRAEKDTRDARGTCISLARCAPSGPGGNPPDGGENGAADGDADNASSHGSKNPLLAQLLPWGDPAEDASSASSASNASISGYSEAEYPRSEEEEGPNIPENGGVEGVSEPKNGSSRQVPRNTSTASITSMEGSEETLDGSLPAPSSEAFDGGLTPYERAQRLRERLRAEEQGRGPEGTA